MMSQYFTRGDIVKYSPVYHKTPNEPFKAEAEEREMGRIDEE
jgi:hypothetical protein